MGAVNSDVSCIQHIFAFVMENINKETGQKKSNLTGNIACLPAGCVLLLLAVVVW